MVTCTRLIALAPSSFGCSVIMASSIGSHGMTAYGYMYSAPSSFGCSCNNGFFHRKSWDDSLWLHVLT